VVRVFGAPGSQSRLPVRRLSRAKETVAYLPCRPGGNVLALLHCLAIHSE
jgi:hypothetical protein